MHSVSPRRQTLRVTAAATSPGRGVREGGVRMTLHYLDKDATARFVKTHAGSDTCPAPFFNRHAKQKLFYTNDAAMQKRLKAWKQERYGDVSQWQTAKITGRCLTGSVEATRDGEPVFGPTNLYEDCLAFLVEDLTLEPFRAQSTRS